MHSLPTLEGLSAMTWPHDVPDELRRRLEAIIERIEAGASPAEVAAAIRAAGGREVLDASGRVIPEALSIPYA